MRVPAFMSIRSPADLMVRSLWLVLGVVHVAPLVRVGSAMLAGDLETARWLSLLGLTLSLIFFALKAAGLPLLRIHCRRTGLVIFLLACGLLHGNATAHDWFQKTGYTTLAIATAAGVQGSIRFGRRLRAAVDPDCDCEPGWAGARRLLAMLVRLVRDSVAADLAHLRRIAADVESLVEQRCLMRALVCEGPPRPPPTL